MPCSASHVTHALVTWSQKPSSNRPCSCRSPTLASATLRSVAYSSTCSQYSQALALTNGVVFCGDELSCFAGRENADLHHPPDLLLCMVT